MVSFDLMFFVMSIGASGLERNSEESRGSIEILTFGVKQGGGEEGASSAQHHRTDGITSSLGHVSKGREWCVVGSIVVEV